MRSLNLEEPSTHPRPPKLVEKRSTPLVSIAPIPPDLLQTSENSVGELLSGSGTLEITSDGLSLGDDGQSSSLDVVGDGVEGHWRANRTSQLRASREFGRGSDSLCLSIIRPERRRAVGLAFPCPAISGADRKRNERKRDAKVSFSFFSFVSSRVETRSCVEKRRMARQLTRSVNSLEDRSVSTDVSRGSKTESTDESSAHIGKNVSVEVRGDEDGVGEGSGVLDDLLCTTKTKTKKGGCQEGRGRGGDGGERRKGKEVDGTNSKTSSVKEILVVSDLGVLLSDLPAGLEEHAVGELPVRVERTREKRGQPSARTTDFLRELTSPSLPPKTPLLPRAKISYSHNSSLVHSSNSVPSTDLSVVERVSSDSLGSVVGDQLDGLNDTIDDLVLDTGVLSLGVLSDENGVDVVVGGLETDDGRARSNVGEEVEGSSEGEVEGDVSLSDCRRGRWEWWEAR